MVLGRRRTADGAAARDRALLEATLRLVRADLAAERDTVDALTAREADLVRARDTAVRELRALAVRLQLDVPAAGAEGAQAVREGLDDLDGVIAGLTGASVPVAVPDVTLGDDGDHGPVAEFVAELRAVTADAAAAAGLRPALSIAGPLERVPVLVARRLHAALRAALVDVLRRNTDHDAVGSTLAVDVTATDSGVTLTVADEGRCSGAVADDERAARLGGWCVRHRTSTGCALVWHVPHDRGLTADPRAASDPTGLVAEVVGQLTTRLAVAHGADRLAVAGDTVRGAVTADGYCVLVLVDAGAHVEVVRAGGYPAEQDPTGAVLPADQSVGGHVMRTGRPVRIATVADVPHDLHHGVRLPVGRLLVVPVRLAAASGALVLTREAGRPPFTGSDEDAAVTLAAVVSAVLELQPVQDVIDTWPGAEFDYTGSNPGRGFPYAIGPGGPSATA
ncbi:GAF domain-containing protein [Jatrophihabitans fulvus]